MANVTYRAIDRQTIERFEVFGQSATNIDEVRNLILKDKAGREFRTISFHEKPIDGFYVPISVALVTDGTKHFNIVSSNGPK